MIRTIVWRVDPEKINAEKFQKVLDELNNLGVLFDTEIMYEDSDKTCADQILRITDLLKKEDDKDVNAEKIVSTTRSNAQKEESNGGI